MVETNTIMAPIFVVTVCYILYYYYITNTKENYNVVASNSYNAPKVDGPLEKNWDIINKQFGVLVKRINSTNYQVSYQMENIIDAFEKILNKYGKYKILSVEESKTFTLNGVIIQDVGSFFVKRFKRVDFIIDSIDPFLIKNVIIDTDNEFISSEFVNPRDELRNDSMFRIKNNLHLFAPYNTSDNEKIRTKYDANMLKHIIKEKEKEMLTF
jgi:hypothetical protein